jgi:hypothetical protein
METTQQKRDRRAAEGAESWEAYKAEQKRIDDNMMRLRAARLARETLPRTQGEKTKPSRPAKSSKSQNTADRP